MRKPGWNVSHAGILHSSFLRKYRSLSRIEWTMFIEHQQEPYQEPQLEVRLESLGEIRLIKTWFPNLMELS